MLAINDQNDTDSVLVPHKLLGVKGLFEISQFTVSYLRETRIPIMSGSC